MSQQDVDQDLEASPGISDQLCRRQRCVTAEHVTDKLPGLQSESVAVWTIVNEAWQYTAEDLEASAQSRRLRSRSLRSKKPRTSLYADLPAYVIRNVTLDDER